MQNVTERFQVVNHVVYKALAFFEHTRGHEGPSTLQGIRDSEARGITIRSSYSSTCVIVVTPVRHCNLVFLIHMPSPHTFGVNACIVTPTNAIIHISSLTLVSWGASVSDSFCGPFPLTWTTGAVSIHLFKGVSGAHWNC